MPACSTATVAGPAARGPAPRQRPRRRLTTAALVVVPTALAAWFIAGLLNDPNRPGATTRAPVELTEPTPAPSTAPDVAWQDFAGLDLPVSAAAGPHCQQAGRASCFTHTDRGAALAAIHLLVRTFPFAGSAVFTPTIAEQVVGPDVAALVRLTANAYAGVAPAARVRDGAPIRSEGGWVAGYRLQPGDTENEPTVRVLIRQTGEGDATGFTEYAVRLTWQHGDWRLIAPAWGDWRSAARPMRQADPDAYTTYDGRH